MFTKTHFEKIDSSKRFIFKLSKKQFVVFFSFLHLFLETWKTH